MTDPRVRVVQPDPIRSTAHAAETLEDAPKDSDVSWLVGVMVELSRRFIGHAVKRYPAFGSSRHECPKCGYRG